MKLSLLKLSIPALLLCFAGSALADPAGSMTSSSEAATVPTAMDSATADSAKMGTPTSALGETVQKKLNGDTRLQNATIEAKVTGTGSVLLEGTVDSTQQSQIAEQVASNVSGVSTVRNELRVPKGE